MSIVYIIIVLMSAWDPPLPWHVLDPFMLSQTQSCGLYMCMIACINELIYTIPNCAIKILLTMSTIYI